MNGKDLIDEIRDAVDSVKKQNQEVISVDALLNYLHALESDVSESNEDHVRQHEASLVQYQVENEKNIAHYNAQQLHSVELFRSVITYGEAALKSAILINGGAAVALLAFIGNIWNKGISEGSAAPLTAAITSFSFGVLAAALGTAGSYLAQFLYSQNYQRSGKTFHTFAVVSVICSYVLFAFGVAGSYESFVTQLSPNK